MSKLKNTKLPNIFVISMYPSVNLKNEQVLNGLLNALEMFEVFTPTHWGHSELTRLSYDRELLLEKASNENKSEIHIHRTTTVDYTGYFNLNRSFSAFFQMKFKSIPQHMWPQLFELSNYIAQEIQPRFGITHMFWPTEIPWQNERQRYHRWMNFSAQTAPVNFGTKGPLGLGNRTYLSHDVMDLFGEKVIQSAPVYVENLDWGGVFMDIVERPWEAAPDQVLDSWIKAMEHLQSTKILAIPEFNFNDKRTVTFNSNARWREFVDNYISKQ